MRAATPVRLRGRCARCAAPQPWLHRLSQLDLCADCFDLEVRELGVGG